MSKFKPIGTFFYADRVGLYLGCVVASEDAIYLVSNMAPLNAKSFFTGKFVKPGSIGPDSLPHGLAELPESITSDPDWPFRTNDGRVCVIYKDTLVSMWCSLLGNMKLSDTEHTAIVRSGIIQRFAMLRVLREFRWPV